MNNNNISVREFSRFLQLVEDYLASGFRSPGGPAPEQQEPEKSLPHHGPETPAHDRAVLSRLEELNAQINACTKCDLHFNRLHPVPGEGVLQPLVMIIGEAPGEEEDKKARPFVGRAGQYLDKWLAAITLDRRSNCFITNVVKCRPPENRDPHPEEIERCRPYLERQIALLAPGFLLSLGRISSQTLVGEKKGIGALRGGTYFYKNLPLVPTFHPSAVLRNQELRAGVWEDLKLLRTLMS
jgi:uracil-DNA glycosylase family 4